MQDYTTENKFKIGQRVFYIDKLEIESAIVMGIHGKAIHRLTPKEDDVEDDVEIHHYTLSTFCCDRKEYNKHPVELYATEEDAKESLKKRLEIRINELSMKQDEENS
jgi:hypothetical protein